MFKKLKDKIAEEVKISPLKLQTSVQQLAQAMVSPSSSISSIQESASNENFSIAEESEVTETPRNSPEKENSTFHRVDLRGDVTTPPRCPPVPRSRRSSASSMMSDVSSLFPVYESPNNAYHFQSDLESTSEIEEIGGSTSHLQGISKEQLLMAYRNTQARYHKYKGRYVDLARHFKELERQNGKIKVLLVETQDRALLKISELKEQCMLEQKAKAHLEDALRNDLEEKDHLINTLETKVKLLKDVDVNASKSVRQKKNEISDELLVDLDGKRASQAASQLLAQSEHSLQDKVSQLEAQLQEYQQSLSEQSEKLHQLSLDKAKVDSALVSQADENQKLKRELEAQRKREEEAALSLAENKMQVHRELEAREEEAKKLKVLVAQLQEDLRISNRRKHMSNGESIVVPSESVGSMVVEDSGAGGDSLPPLQPPTSELMQLKEVLRGKYKEVEVLVAENGRLRASLLMANSENDNLGRKLENNEHHETTRQSVLEMNSSDYTAKDKKTSTREPHSGNNFLLGQCSDGDDSSQEVELKNLSDVGTLSVTTGLNKKNIDLSVEEQLRSEVEVKRVTDIENELLRIDTEWKFKYNGVKEELDRLISEKEEMRKLLMLEEIPSELIGWTYDYSDAAVSRDSLVHSLIPILKEKSKWKKEEEMLTSRLKELGGECDMLKGMLKKLEAERNALGLSVEQNKGEVDRLNGELEILRQMTKELQREKDVCEDEVVYLREIAVNFDQLKNELNGVRSQSTLDKERMKAQCLSEVSTVLATLEGKEKELQQVKTQLEHAVSLTLNTWKEEELIAKCCCMEKEVQKERELRLAAEYSAKVLHSEFVAALVDGKSIQHEALENIKLLEQEVDRLKAQCEGHYLQEEETKKIIQELRRTYDKQLIELQKNGERAMVEVESMIKERDEARRGETEAQQKAADALCERDALRVKKQEAESRATKVENELKAVRELEEKAKVEAEEAVHEQAAMRRSWEMQRDQIESMSREIEGLKKAEDGLIRVLKEVREEAKSKECEIKRMGEESVKEKKLNLMNEEKNKNDLSGLKKLIEEHTAREEQIRKEMDKVKEVTNEWMAKSDVHQKELETLYQEKKSLQRKLEIKEGEALKSAEAIERLTKELVMSVNNEGEIKLELTVLSQEMDTIKNVVDRNKKEVENLKHGNVELNTLKKDLEEKLEVVENERDRLRRREKEGEEAVIQLKGDREKYKCQMENARVEMEKLKVCMDNLERRCNEMENEAEEKKAENERLRMEWEEMDKEVVVLGEKVIEMMENDKQLRKELEYLQSKSLKETELADKDVIERQEIKEESFELEVGVDLVQRLKADRDEAVKDLDAANKKVKTLEEQISSLNSRLQVEGEELMKEVHSLKEKLNLRNKELGEVAYYERMKEELKRVVESKEELEKSLTIAQEEASKKKELEARVEDLEQLMKKMEREFDAAICSRDEEHQEELSSYSERMEGEVDYIRRQLMEEIKGLRGELIVKGDAYEQLLEQHNEMLNKGKIELDVIRRTVSKEKEKANKTVENETSRWMAQIYELEMKHKKTIEDLQRAWDAEKKDLEVTSKVAVAAVESGTDSMSYLKRQIQAQARELSETKRKYSSEILELRHLLSLGRRGIGETGKSRLDDSTELEYLRNILYEYMMGKEPMVLARVIAAVVKFDDEQTKKILTKEEQKQTLLGQFGLT